MMREFPIRSTAFVVRSRQKAREVLSAARLLLGPEDDSSRRIGFVLTYHRVLPEETSLPYPIQPGMVVTAKTFERHLCWLRDRYEVVSLSTLGGRLQERESNGPVCAITFDDGWRDTYSVVFSLLKRYELPATVFITSDYVGTQRWFWPERLGFLTGALETSTGEALAELADGRIEELKLVSPGERDRVIGELEDECRKRGIAFPREPQMMTWDEIREMASAGIEIGSHTCSHVILTEVDASEAEKEIVDSKRMIEEELGRHVDLFCYPNGNHTTAIREMVRGAGYRLAVSTEPGMVDGDSDPWALPRIAVHEDVSRTRSQLWLRIRDAAQRKSISGRMSVGGVR
jgi:peptidoglycan/xylan/chitin deacetylase (PgdA/CDA1 family)